MTASLRRRDGDIQVQGSWIGDNDRLWPVNQGCLQIYFHWET
jgi:hypothetical protein